MCEERISDAEQAAARAAGWRAEELEWERRQERAAETAAADAAQAAALWAEALHVARENFAVDDPRLGMSFANAARAGGGEDAAAMLLRARQIWDMSAAWIDRIQPERRARSSLHHLRMELKNRAVYDAAARRKLHDAAADARLRLAGAPASPARIPLLLARWRAEKPPLFGSSRKLLAACLLLMYGD